ncbi:hypothetical protein [Actinomadura macra]|uniref:hypothetical protein n=1 Tax=Actinomadura macra TaxID=46164 RepID=UPI0008354359|nr:hypothetical protein [Actinomadura macra]
MPPAPSASTCGASQPAPVQRAAATVHRVPSCADQKSRTWDGPSTTAYGSATRPAGTAGTSSGGVQSTPSPPSPTATPSGPVQPSTPAASEAAGSTARRRSPPAAAVASTTRPSGPAVPTAPASRAVSTAATSAAVATDGSAKSPAVKITPCRRPSTRTTSRAPGQSANGAVWPVRSRAGAGCRTVPRENRSRAAALSGRSSQARKIRPSGSSAAAGAPAGVAAPPDGTGIESCQAPPWKVLARNVRPVPRGGTVS